MLISIILPDLRGGGAERVHIDLAHEFSSAGHDVEFVLMKARGAFLDEVRKSFSVVDLDIHRFRALPFALVRYLRRRRPAALLAAMWPLTAITPFAARMSGHRCKVLVSEHGMSAEYRDWGLRHRALLRISSGIGYRLAHIRVGVSAGLIQDMANLSWMRPDRFHVIHNPVPLRPEPSACAIREAEALWSAPTGARIITVGRIKAVKNHPLLLRAFAQLERPEARLMFVGEGAGRDALLKLAKELGIADRVIFAGFQSDPTPFYKTADLFVLTSNYEGFGNVIVEALACGTPVVSTDCPSGPAEILDFGRFGRLVPVGDAISLTRAITASLDTQVGRDVLKERAADFAPSKASERYLRLFERGT
ncbi:glycosyltransferase [Martelella mediterranea]|uniref:glycosyltransferase n=1 Tax=Martelella mediterranea TaxID=293089 RepID=UPI001E3C149A|nr:glycosyltransferase [Martelella mediterranea]MCD1636367.1 glycosyltransferase [Martelella mediterranea]